MAITEGAIDFLLSHNCKVKVVMRYNRTNFEFKESYDYLLNRYGNKIELFESPFTLDRTEGFGTTLSNYIDGFLKLIGFKGSPELHNIISWSDYVLFDGGNLFRCENLTDYARLKALFFPLKVAYKKGIPFSILPQSASNINFLGKRSIKNIVKKAEYVFLREPSSFKKMNKYYPESSEKFYQSLDMAYLTNRDLDPDFDNIEINNNTIAITVRAQTVGDLKDLGEHYASKIEKQITETAKYFLDKGYKILMVSQCIKDDEITKKITKELSGNVDLIYERNPAKLRRIYSDVELLIGMRLHSIIMAASVGTLSYGYFMKEWGLKNPGMMNLMQLPFSFVDDSGIEQDKVNELLEDLDNQVIFVRGKIEELKGILEEKIFDPK